MDVVIAAPDCSTVADLAYQGKLAGRSVYSRCSVPAEEGLPSLNPDRAYAIGPGVMR